MKVVREVETKLSVPPDFEPPRLVDVKGVDRVAVRRMRLKAVHVDTEDLRLARSGTTLRHRTGEGKPQWTLKLPSTATVGLVRDELSVLGPGTRVPEALRELLTAQFRGAPLHAVVELRTARTSTLLFDADGNPLVEVVDDEVDVHRDGRRVDGWRELEVEQAPQGGTVASRVLKALRAAGAVIGDQTPKAIRALGPEATKPADLPQVHPVAADDPAGDLVLRALALGINGIVEHDLDVRRDLEDAVHQLRVTCRRLRSDLQMLRPLIVDERLEVLRGELTWLAGSFGQARDLEVLRDRLRATACEDPLAPIDIAPLDAVLAEEQQAQLMSALAVLQSVRYLGLLQLLHDLAGAPALHGDAQQPCSVALPPLVTRSHKRLGRAASALSLEDADDAWHEVRKLAKRSRYNAEAVAPVLGKQPHAKHAKRLQTLLGEHQDAVFTADRCRALARAHPELAFVCGQLVARERSHVIATRKDFLS